MTEDCKKMLELLPTANSVEIKIAANVLHHIIYCLEETIKAKNLTIESLNEIIKSQDERIETLKESLDLLENQSTQREFEKVFKGKYIGEA